MAGNGSRTKSYGDFKPFITIEGKKIIEWCLSSVKHHFEPNDELVFITTLDFDRRYGFQDELAALLCKLQVANRYAICLAPQTPRGPAESVYLAKEFIPSSTPCMIVNCDQYIVFEKVSMPAKTAVLPVFVDTGQTKSYVVFEAEHITKVEEKQNSSNVASAGVYGVTCGADLINALERQFENGETVNGEYYVGPALNYLIEKGYTLTAIPCRAKFDLGSISGIETFKKFIFSMKDMITISSKDA